MAMLGQIRDDGGFKSSETISLPACSAASRSRSELSLALRCSAVRSSSELDIDDQKIVDAFTRHGS
jgi:hypothetical protein